MVSPELQDFAEERKAFWWWVGNPRELPEESIVEGTLNYGNWDDVQELIRLMGMDEVARVFTTLLILANAAEAIIIRGFSVISIYISNAMQRWHKEILTKEQLLLLPVLARFKSRFGMVGGTAIALHIGHRESIDFDMFTPDTFNNAAIRQVFRRTEKPIEPIRSWGGQLTFKSSGVSFSFFHFPYPVEYSEDFDNSIRMPNLLSLAAVKAFALGQRSKWKGYVDLYFILRDHYSIEDISHHAKQLFAGEFNAKLFREQLSYFNDVNYAEKVTYMPGFAVPDEEVKQKLTDFALS